MDFLSRTTGFDTRVPFLSPVFSYKHKTFNVNHHIKNKRVYVLYNTFVMWLFTAQTEGQGFSMHRREEEGITVY
jgi:hypothetical protein